VPVRKDEKLVADYKVRPEESFTIGTGGLASHLERFCHMPLPDAADFEFDDAARRETITRICRSHLRNRAKKDDFCLLQRSCSVGWHAGASKRKTG